MTQILATLLQNGGDSPISLKSIVNHIQYQNIHVVNVRRMFPLRQGICLIPHET